MLSKLVERLGHPFQHHVISLSSVGEIGSTLVKAGMPVESLGLRAGISGIGPGVLGLARHLRQLQPDVVQTWMYHADLLGGLAARMAGVKVIAWNIRNSDLSPARTKASTRAVVRGCALLSRWLPNRIVCCSEVARGIHERLGYDSSKFTIIPNGFDLLRFKPDQSARWAVRDELGLVDDAPLVGLIARYDPQKNHTGLLEAAARLHCFCPGVNFMLVGQGVDRCNDTLVDEIRRLELDKVTHLLGLRADIPRLMAALDVLASSSHGEAFPNVLGEAMACGIPCVVTDVGDSAAIVGDTGRVVPPSDMSGLAAALAELLALPSTERRYLGQKCRKRVAENYDLCLVAASYGNLYEKMATNCKGA